MFYKVAEAYRRWGDLKYSGLKRLREREEKKKKKQRQCYGASAVGHRNGR